MYFVRLRLIYNSISNYSFLITIAAIVIGIFSVLIIIYAIDTLIGILAVVGAVKKRKNFLMPWIVTQGIAVCLSVCLLITVMAISASWNILQIAATIGMLLALRKQSCTSTTCFKLD